ncbi:NAD-dependent epimerase/dehydratase family protein [Pseudoroseomonas globiformis]|uniref:NAD-dependent epimerase/dehydratase family protein n=1 Tax=Teichococcus globiformis TaxID=2307229 RepID=A0ABV7FXL7_9PROT
MRLLLTGSSGFLGRHVLAAAAAADVEVIRAVRANETIEENVLALGPAPWTREVFERALQLSQPDVVVHCAGITHAETTQQFLEANTLPAAAMLDAVAQVAAPPRVILLGSAAEYGFIGADMMPVREDHPCQPRSAYGISKHSQTLLGLAAAERGLTVLTVRLFNAVGVGMPSGLALSSFARRIARALKDGSVLRTGDMTVARDFIDVAEAAKILVALADCPGWPWPVVNLCSGHAFRLGTLMETMIAATGRPLRTEIDPRLLRPGDMPVLTGSVERLAELGLRPQGPQFDRLIPLLLAEAQAAV